MNIKVEDLDQWDLLLMTCTAVPNELKKEKWIKDDTLLFHDVHIKDGNSIINPSFHIKSRNSIWKYNYVYFGGTKRYYFVDDIQMDLGGSFILKCSVDVLMSFQKAIMNCMAFESRSSGIGTGYIADDKIIFNSAPVSRVYEFYENPKEGCNFNDKSYILGVANDGKYYNFDDDEFQNNPNISDISNIKNLGCMDGVLAILIQAVKEGWIYSKPNRAANGYADCSSLIGKALFVSNYPNNTLSYFHLSSPLPDTQELCKFLTICSTGCNGQSPDVWIDQTKIARTSKTVPTTFDVLPQGSIIFTAREEGNEDDTRYPATYPVMEYIIGVPDNLRGKSGVGHVMFYAGALGYNSDTDEYDFWKSEYVQNSKWTKIGDNCIIHTTGAGNWKGRIWNPTTHKLEDTTAPNTAFICVATSHSRFMAAFTPDYTVWGTKWGGE